MKAVENLLLYLDERKIRSLISPGTWNTGAHMLSELLCAVLYANMLIHN